MQIEDLIRKNTNKCTNQCSRIDKRCISSVSSKGTGEVREQGGKTACHLELSIGNSIDSLKAVPAEQMESFARLVGTAATEDVSCQRRKCKNSKPHD
jgi:hypothetical protein